MKLIPTLKCFCVNFSLLLILWLANAQAAEETLEQFLQGVNATFSQYGNEEMVARWDYITNVTDEHADAMNEARLRFQEVKKNTTIRLEGFNTTDPNADLERQKKFYKSLGSKLTTDQLQEMNRLGSKMESIYSTAKICPYSPTPQESCEATLPLEPDLLELFATSRNHEELKHAWTEWRKVSGNKYRQEYLDFIDINQKGSTSLGFNNLKEQWLERYENADFAKLIEKVWTEEVDVGGKKISLENFYKQFHAYVRSKLRNFYKEANIKKNGYIPAHLLGNMWAQQWDNIEPLVQPYNDTPIFDVSEAMKKQNYTALKMFQTAEAFFVSMGFEPMTDKFWDLSMIEKPDDREVVCHGSAEEFYSQDDFRIKMCTTITHSDLVTVHHEMGHIAYFMEYKNQPFVYREAANPGFHEAIGDTMALAVNTPDHLADLGLMDKLNSTETDKEDISYLFHVALQKLVFLPFAYTMDLWRWRLFTGEIDNSNMNEDWWNLRRQLQGLDAPVERTEEDFDAGAKYHIPANVPYVRYFVSFIVQFQFYEALCKDAGEYVPADANSKLFKCDFSKGGEKTGKLIRDLMEAGFSKQWPDALESMTGSKEMSAKSFITYFLPLYTFLEKENEGECIGWAGDCEDEAKKWLDEVYEKDHRELDQEVGQKEWEYQTWITDANSDASIEALKRLQAYDKQVWFDHITQYDYEHFNDSATRRRFENLALLGNAAMEEENLSEFNKLVSEMTGIYAAGKVCPFDKQNCDLPTEGLTLEPGISEVMDNPADHTWEELEYFWKNWRDASGKQMKTKFLRYIDLSNEAAKANNLPDASEMWLGSYLQDDDKFRDDLEVLWQQIQPLYEKLHAYVRFKLRNHWGEDKIGKYDPMPAHIFGNMWAQEWSNVLKLVTPFPNVTNPLDEVNQNLIKQNYTSVDLFELSNDFYMKLGLANMSMCYTTDCGKEDNEVNHNCTKQNPMIEKPDWDVVCHASAWDMYKASKDDYRIKMCTAINLLNLVTIHHEMGHIQYYIQYEDQPLQFRAGGNNGFHEAIGDTMALAVQTPAHLQGVGLLDDVSTSYEADINYLLKSALDKVAFLPFGYTLDQYRWALFDGSNDVKELNKNWWKKREKYQGIVPPVQRSEEDFDAGAKYHIAADVPYIRYFAAHILQFMFYQKMCELSKQYDPTDKDKPLYKCDFSNGDSVAAAGAEMKKMLAAGRSKPWPDILEEMTGSRKLKATPMLEYFQPLSDWLDNIIVIADIPVGWNSTVDDFFPGPTTTTVSTTTVTTASSTSNATTSTAASTPKTTSKASSLNVSFAIIVMPFLLKLFFTEK